MTYLPRVPLELATPSGKRALLELSSKRTDSIADAQRNTTRAVYSRDSMVLASITRTPLARPRFGSNITSATTLFGRSVRLPVFCAAGSVEPRLVKYEWVMHPRSHGPQ